MPVLPHSTKRFDIIALYRNDHSRALTNEELADVRLAANIFGNHTRVFGAMQVTTFRMEMKARDQKDAMASFHEMAPGAEIISCYYIDEEKFLRLRFFWKYG